MVLYVMLPTTTLCDASLDAISYLCYSESASRLEYDRLAEIHTRMHHRFP